MSKASAKVRALWKNPNWVCKQRIKPIKVKTMKTSSQKAAHDELVGRGIDASEVWHGPPVPPEARLSGPDPKRTSYGSFCSFNDPDGNTWLVQEVTTRLPDRI